MDYEKKFLIGDYVKGKRTFNGEVIEGKFNGFRLYNKLNPKSVVGVIDTDERCYDVSVDSIESIESEDEQHRKWILEYLYDGLRKSDEQFKDQYKSAIAWLEKQGEKSVVWSEEDDKIYQSIIDDTVQENQLGGNQIAWLKSLKNRVIIQPKSEWNKEDIDMIQDAIHWIQQFQKSDRCKDENDMQNSVTCENWLKSLKDRNDNE